ncbi:MAG TPA: fluoride efflux transporter CrcB [Acetobacteraceae bacterium]|nr:fluoride efflux transporter CrcB [Acetobacteraceae bacterium]
MRLSLLVLVGSALGGLARFWLGAWMLVLTGPDFPWGTLLINVLGSLVIGVAAAAVPVADADTRAFVMVGLCGGFTTFSAYSLQSLELLQAGRVAPALGYMAGSAAACLAATWAGWLAGRAV